MAVALCTFTTDGGEFNLGTEDCFVTASKERGRTIYTVNSHYVDREGNRFFIDGETRGRAETYVAELAAALNVAPLSEVEGPDGPLYVPDSGAQGGVLRNPYTDLEEEGCYCTAVEHEDEGGRLYGIVFTFEKPDTDAGAVPADSIVKYKDVDLGNLPGYIVETPDSNFITYNVTCTYRGDDEAEYPNRLATECGMLPFVAQEIVRADIGTLGSIKSWNAEPGTLVWATRGFSVDGLYMRDISVNRQAPGVIVLTINFVKER